MVGFLGSVLSENLNIPGLNGQKDPLLIQGIGRIRKRIIRMLIQSNSPLNIHRE